MESGYYQEHISLVTMECMDEPLYGIAFLRS